MNAAECERFVGRALPFTVKAEARQMEYETNNWQEVVTDPNRPHTIRNVFQEEQEARITFRKAHGLG